MGLRLYFKLFPNSKSGRPKVFCKKEVLRNLTKFTEKPEPESLSETLSMPESLSK